MYFKRHVSAHVSEPSLGLIQELTYTVVWLKLRDVVLQYKRHVDKIQKLLV
jgi:hypothetical protein